MMKYQDEILKCTNSDEIHDLLSSKLSSAKRNSQMEKTIADEFTATIKHLISIGRISIVAGRIDYLAFLGTELPFFMSGTILRIK